MPMTPSFGILGKKERLPLLSTILPGEIQEMQEEFISTLKTKTLPYAVLRSA